MIRVEADFVRSNLQKYMQEKGITPIELERRTGMRSQTILNIMHGKNSTTLAHAYLLSWALAVPIEELFPFDAGRAYEYVVKKRIGSLPKNQ
jgi:transcriptional regulator with XRE-family HTH domain